MTTQTFFARTPAIVRQGCVTVPPSAIGASFEIRTGLRAGGNTLNHNSLQLRTGVKAGGVQPQHNALVVRTGVRAGGGGENHNSLQLRTGVKAGGLVMEY